MTDLPDSSAGMPDGRSALLADGRHPLIITIIALTLFALFMSVARWRSKAPRDFYQFWGVGEAVRRHAVVDIYSEADRSRIGEELSRAAVRGSSSMRMASHIRTKLEPAGTPFLYAVFDLVATGRFERDYRWYRIASGLFFVLGLFYLTQVAGLGAGWGALFVLITTQIFYPLRVDITAANVNQLQIGYFAALIELSRRRSTSALAAAEGAGLAFGFLFKPTMAYVCLFLVVLEVSNGQWERLMWQAVSFLAASAVAVAVTSWRFGSAVSWPHWFSEFQGMVFQRKFTSQSMAAMVFGIDNMAVDRLLSILGVGAIIALIMTTQPNGRSTPHALRMDARGRLHAADFRERWLAISLGMGVYIGTAPLVHGHYFVLMLPAIVYLFSPIAQDSPLPEISLQKFLLFTAMVLISFHPFFRRLGFREGPYHDMWTHIGSLLVTCLCARELYRLRVEAPLREGLPKG